MSTNTKLVVIAIIIVFMIFFPPFMVMTAWNGFATGFNLPTFSYWQWFIVLLAIRLINGRIDFKTISES